MPSHRDYLGRCDKVSRSGTEQEIRALPSAGGSRQDYLTGTSVTLLPLPTCCKTKCPTRHQEAAA
jgi:hypothetical protein